MTDLVQAWSRWRGEEFSHLPNGWASCIPTLLLVDSGNTCRCSEGRRGDSGIGEKSNICIPFIVKMLFGIITMCLKVRLGVLWRTSWVPPSFAPKKKKKSEPCTRIGKWKLHQRNAKSQKTVETYQPPISFVSGLFVSPSRKKSSRSVKFYLQCSWLIRVHDVLLLHRLPVQGLKQMAPDS